MREFAVICLIFGVSFVTTARLKPFERLRSESSLDKVNDETVPIVNATYVQRDSPEKILYTGSQLWKLTVETQSEKDLLAQLREQNEIEIWTGNSTNLDILVKSDMIDKIKDILAPKSIKYEVMIDDLQTIIDSEKSPIVDTDHTRAHRMTWHAYHRLSDIFSYLDYLPRAYPNICSVRSIGASVQGRAIRVLKLSNNNPDNKIVWVDGGIHAREWISPATVTFLINEFVTRLYTQSSTLQNIDWYFAPVLNPDGYEYSHTTDRLWRKNRAASGHCAGVDLNRNFGYQWGGKGASRNPCTETYCGRGPFSEPETQAVQQFILNNFNKTRGAYISFHSYGQYVLYPWGYDRVVPPDYQDLDRVGRKMANAIRAISGLSYTVGSASNTLYPASGGSDDWAKGLANFKYAYTIELRDNGRYGFLLPASFIQSTAKEALAAIQVIAAAVANA